MGYFYFEGSMNVDVCRERKIVESEDVFKD